MLVDLQAATQNSVPPKQDIESWIAATLAGRTAMEHAEVSVRLVDSEEMAVLNEKYRGKKGPTNVLSFPADPSGLPPEVAALLGDIAVCAPVVAREAHAQGKPEVEHWAHLVVHGVLHLLGYDHESAGEAREMEDLEIDILRCFGIADPYVHE